VSSQFDTIPQNPDTLVSYWQRLTILIADIRLLNSSCRRTGGRPCKCYVTGQNITVHWARPAPCVGFPLYFQTVATPCVSNLMAVSSLMQSARHVTAHVHIRFWISKYEYVGEST
jgi:hypothetical protein